jgi:hypothetical protein
MADIPTINKILDAPKEANVAVRKSNNLSKKAQTQQAHSEILNKFAPDSMAQLINVIKKLDKKMPAVSVDRESKRKEQKRIIDREKKVDLKDKQKDQYLKIKDKQKEQKEAVKDKIKDKKEEKRFKDLGHSFNHGGKRDRAGDFFGTPLVKGLTQGLLGGFNLLFPPLEAIVEPLKALFGKEEKGYGGLGRHSKGGKSKFEDNYSEPKNKLLSDDTYTKINSDNNKLKEGAWDKSYNLLNNIWLTEFRIDNTLSDIKRISNKSISQDYEPEAMQETLFKQSGDRSSKQLGAPEQELLPSNYSQNLLPDLSNQLLLPDLRAKPEGEKGSSELTVEPAQFYKKTPRREDIRKIDPGAVLIYDLLDKGGLGKGKKGKEGGEDNVVGDVLVAGGIAALLPKLLGLIAPALAVGIAAALTLGLAEIVMPGNLKRMISFFTEVLGGKMPLDKWAAMQFGEETSSKFKLPEIQERLKGSGITEEEWNKRSKSDYDFFTTPNEFATQLLQEKQLGIKDKKSYTEGIPKEQRKELLKQLWENRPQDEKDQAKYTQAVLGELAMNNDSMHNKEYERVTKDIQAELNSRTPNDQRLEAYTTLADKYETNYGGVKSPTPKPKTTELQKAESTNPYSKKHSGGKAYEEQLALLRKDEVVLSPTQSKMYNENNGANSKAEIKSMINDIYKNMDNQNNNQSNEMVMLLRELNKTLKDKQLNNNTVVQSNNSTFDPNTIRYGSKK